MVRRRLFGRERASERMNVRANRDKKRNLTFFFANSRRDRNLFGAGCAIRLSQKIILALKNPTANTNVVGEKSLVKLTWQ